MLARSARTCNQHEGKLEHTKRALGLLVVTGALLAASPRAAASDAGDTVFLKNGGRVRGVVLEEDPAAGTRLKLPDGTVRAFAPKDVDHVEYESKPAVPDTAQAQISVAPPPEPRFIVVPSSGWSPDELAQIHAASPERIPFQRHRLAPPGYHYDSHLRHPFWITGAALILTALVADVMALTLDNGKPGENGTAAAVASIIGFGAGIPLLVYGLIPAKAYVRNDLGWFVRPTVLTARATVSGAGLVAGISF